MICLAYQVCWGDNTRAVAIRLLSAFFAGAKGVYRLTVVLDRYNAIDHDPIDLTTVTARVRGLASGCGALGTTVAVEDDS
jgi:hypothetical protein